MPRTSRMSWDEMGDPKHGIANAPAKTGLFAPSAETLPAVTAASGWQHLAGGESGTFRPESSELVGLARRGITDRTDASPSLRQKGQPFETGGVTRDRLTPASIAQTPWGVHPRRSHAEIRIRKGAAITTT